MWFMKLLDYNKRAMKVCQATSTRSRERPRRPRLLAPRPPRPRRHPRRHTPRPPPLPDPRLKSMMVSSVLWRAQLLYVPLGIALSWACLRPVSLSVSYQLWWIGVCGLLGGSWCCSRLTDIGRWMDESGYRSSHDEIILRGDKFVRKYPPSVMYRQILWCASRMLSCSGLYLAWWLWLTLKHSIWLSFAAPYRLVETETVSLPGVWHCMALYWFLPWINSFAGGSLLDTSFVQSHLLLSPMDCIVLLVSYTRPHLVSLVNRLQRWWWFISPFDPGYHSLLHDALALLKGAHDGLEHAWTFLPFWRQFLDPYEFDPTCTEVSTVGGSVADVCDFPNEADCNVSASYDVGWRIRRHCRHVADKVDRVLTPKLDLTPQASSTSPVDSPVPISERILARYSSLLSTQQSMA